MKLQTVRFFSSRRGVEIAAVLLLGLALLTFLSLATYQAHDPSFNYQVRGEEAATRNWIGPFGAHLADLLLMLFGFGAFFLSILLFGFGIITLRRGELRAVPTKAFGLLLFLVALSSFFHLVREEIAFGGAPMLSGGLLGRGLYTGLHRAMGVVGADIAVGVLLCLSILIATRFSLADFFAQAGRLLDRLYQLVTAKFFHFREERRKQHLRREVVTKQAERQQKDGRRRPQGQKPTAAPARTAAPAAAAAQPSLDLPKKSQTFVLPTTDLLDVSEGTAALDERELMTRGTQIVEKFAEFDIAGEVVQIHPGPVVTTYEFKPQAGIKYSRITGMVEDLALALEAEAVRVDRIPGKSTIGIEVPNSTREVIGLREVVESPSFKGSPSHLTLALGKTISGEICVADLVEMPHLLIAGATGAGKSVCLNGIITSILFESTPEEVRLVLIDPKKLEMGLYAGIPHLYTPVVTDPRKAAHALRWAVGEMEERYKILAECGVRNIQQFNRLLQEERRTIKKQDGEEQELSPLPLIVIVIDELADLMMVTKKEVEESIVRLAQMSRAVGIHLVLATQRPSVDVITGIIKANLPARIAFRVTTKVDSRTILDSMGAESLLGKGDMLMLPPGSARLQRIHGAFLTEIEVQKVVNHLKQQGTPVYNEEVLKPRKTAKQQLEEAAAEDAQDEVYDEAARLVVRSRQASASYLQRRLRIGYNRAARLIEIMEEDGLISALDPSNNKREVLVAREYFEEIDAAKAADAGSP